MRVAEQMRQLGVQARAAARQLALLPTDQKDTCLRAMADALEQCAGELRGANALDLDQGAKAGLSAAMLDRLKLDDARIHSMARGLREVAMLPDPVGRVLDDRVRPNGLRLQKIAVPIGVIVIIFESRPNVTADAASLCFKSGNACILRGGKEALNSSQLIARTLVEAGSRALADFPPQAIQVVPTADREAIKELLSLTDLVDLCMPRGGEGLIRAVTECSRVPVIKHYKGVCHVYVDAQADPDMAESIVLNAKLQRPAVCNAMETLLVDRRLAADFLPRVARRLAERQVEFRADPDGVALLHSVRDAGGAPLNVRSASDQDFFTEYNDYILNVALVDGVEAAIRHVNRFGSSHSDSIVTRDEPTARRFLAAVDSAAVYWNASTRFTDGAEFGMGAEIGISTDRVGARGPMGLEELTTYKWLGFGSGQVRE